MADPLEKVRTLAPDLRALPPRSPRAVLGGYVLAARLVDKCRATLAGCAGEYTYAVPHSLDAQFFDFTGIDPEALRAVVAEGRGDEELAGWIREQSAVQLTGEIVRWNNRMRDLRLSDVPEAVQIYMEDYIARHIPPGRPIYRFLDVYDIEEGRL